MTNLGQVYLFSNLITIAICSMVWVLVGVVRTQLFFEWFQGWNLLGDDQNFKRCGDVKNGENQISKGMVFSFL